MKTLQQTARPVFGVITLAPRCIRCEAPAIFSLCDANGNPLARRSGGFCGHCAPVQQATEVTPSTGTPASLKTVELASRRYQAAHEAHLQKISALRLDRDWLRLDLFLMENCADDAQYTGNGPTDAEIKAAKARLNELDEMLILDA